MNVRHIAILAGADLKNVRRDPMLIMIVLASVIFGFLLRYLVPWLTGFLDQILRFDLSPWLPLIRTFFLFVGSMLCGFLSAFMILEEKDSRVFESLFTTPVGKSGYWVYRSILPAILSLIANSLTFLIGNTGGINPINSMVFLFCACQSVMFSALLSFVAANKIEALALGKGLGIVMVGIFVPWFLPDPWFWFAAWLPTFWLGLAARSDARLWPLIPGLLVHGAILVPLLVKGSVKYISHILWA